MTNYKKLLYAGVFIFIALAVFLIGLFIINKGKIAYGVKLTGEKISQRDPYKLQELLKNKFSNIEIKFLCFEKSYSLNIKDAGIYIDINATVKNAYRIGRNGFYGILEQIKAISGNYNIPLVVKIDDEKFGNFLNKNFSDLEISSSNAKVVYDKLDNNFKVIPHKIGRKIDRKKLKEQIISNLSNLNKVIYIPFLKDYPKIETFKVEKIKDTANKILENSPYLLKYENYKWTIEKEDILDWIKIYTKDNQIIIDLDKDKIKNLISSLAVYINKPLINAQLEYDGNQVKIKKKSQNKKTLNIQKCVKSVYKSILSNRKIVPLIVDIELAKVRKDNFKKLGLTSLLAVSETDFSGSPPNRVHNIKLSAAKFNKILIPPNSEFSFNKILGEVNENTGYLPELVIKENKTIPEYGGGICQVSTTIFRAAVKAGLKITERYPHAFPVRYYKPIGFDATVYSPHPDLRFINNTPSFIYLQTKVKDNKVYCEIYGTKENKKIEIEGPFILEKKEDGSMKTVLIRKIYKNGKLISEDKFYSNYKSPDLFPVENNQ